MAELTLKKRHRLKKKDIKSVIAKLGEAFGVEPDWADEHLDCAKARTGAVYILGSDIVAAEFGNRTAFTLRGLLRYRPSKGFVTVDMGAVPFVTNGADVMAPGVVDADMDIRPDDVVYVRDQKNLQPLGVGIALVTGKEMAQGTSGAVVKSYHHVGDPLWQFGHEDD
jgi:PUA domain protein